MDRRVVLAGLAAIACWTAVSIWPARADELDDIMKSGKLRVATDVAIPPARMVDSQMRPIGSDVETAQLLAKDWGLQFEIVPTTGPTRIPNALSSGKADFIVSTLSGTPERARVIDFSRAYTTLQSVIGGAKDVSVSTVEGLKGMTVAVTRGITQDTKLTGLVAANGFTVQRYDDDATLVTAGATGQAQLIGTSLALIDAVAQKNPATGFAPKLVLDNFDIAIGVKKGSRSSWPNSTSGSWQTCKMAS